MKIPAGYRGLAEITSAMGALEKKGARVRECAVTHERRSVWCVEIGSPRARGLSLALAGLHALEWIGVECLMGWLDRVASSPPQDRRVLAFPLVNVDGYARVERDLQHGTRRFTRGNARGVDLNRNWPTFFRKRSVASTLLPGVYKPGAAPLSEPETHGVAAAIDHAMSSGASELRAMSLHSVGAKVLYPYGGGWSRPKDHSALRAAAVRVAGKLGPPYVAVQSSRWVPGMFAPGMELDHFYEAYGATSLLIECGRPGLSAFHPSTWRSPFAFFNPPNLDQERERVGRALDDFLLSR